MLRFVTFEFRPLDQLDFKHLNFFEKKIGFSLKFPIKVNKNTLS